MRGERHDIRTSRADVISDDIISSLLQEEHLRAVRKPFQISEFLSAVRETLDTPVRDPCLTAFLPHIWLIFSTESYLRSCAPPSLCRN